MPTARNRTAFAVETSLPAPEAAGANPARIRASRRPGRRRAPRPLNAAFAALALLSACVEANTVTPVALLTLTVAPQTVSLDAIGDTARFTATVRDQHGHQVVGGTVEWTASDPAVASVNGSGLVRAAGNGTAMISATSDSATGTAMVAVAQVAASVTVTPGNVQFASLGRSAQLTGTVHDANGHTLAGAGVTWSSADTSVATVDASGLVRPVADGRASIHAASGDLGGFSTVVVEQVAAAVELRIPGDSILVTDSIRLRANAFDADDFAIPEARFQWESSNPEIARVNDRGYVTGVGLGPVDITVSADEASASASLIVVPYPEDLVLKVLYDLTNGDLWHDNTNWLSDEPVSLWAGIHLNEEGRVRHLVLPGNGLIGSIPPQIQHLEGLESLHLGENDLEGPIPVEVTRLSRLKSLDLNYNAISGELPPEIGNLTELVALSLFGNELTGEIPPEIGRLTKLAYLDLCHNQLRGPIPAEIGNLRELQYLMMCGIDASPMEGNRLSGEIPSTIGNLTQLRILELGANQLTGPIPPEIGNLTALDSLNLYSNLLTGVPEEIGNLRNVKSILLYGNRLTGPIPSSIGSLPRLRRLNFGIGFTSGNNLLSDSIPSGIGNLARLEELDFGGNRLTGSIPETIGDLRRLRRLELGTNHLSGPIPSSIGNLTRLERFAACPDSLEGPIPPEFGKLTRLRELHLCRNRFTGPVPEEFGDLASLQQLNLWSNLLTGELPGTLVSLTELREINFVNNDGLCAPRTREFEAWLAGLRRWFGEFCGEGSAAGDGVRGRVRGDRVGWGWGVQAGRDGEGARCWVTVASRARAGSVGGAGVGGAGGARGARAVWVGDGRMREVVERRAVPCRAGGG